MADVLVYCDSERGWFQNNEGSMGFFLTRQKSDFPARVIELAPSPLGNRALVRGLTLGDRASAEALYDRFGEMVNKLVWKLMGDDDGHDDVVQQTFLSVISSIGRLEDPLALTQWIIRVTINTVKREIRSRKYRRILHLEPVTREIPTECLGPEKLAVVRSFYAIVRKMGEPERIFFILRFVEGYTIGEIASLCECSPMTVKRKIAKARTIFMEEARRDAFIASAIEELDDEP